MNPPCVPDEGLQYRRAESPADSSFWYIKKPSGSRTAFALLRRVARLLPNLLSSFPTTDSNGHSSEFEPEPLQVADRCKALPSGHDSQETADDLCLTLSNVDCHRDIRAPRLTLKTISSHKHLLKCKIMQKFFKPISIRDLVTAALAKPVGSRWLPIATTPFGLPITLERISNYNSHGSCKAANCSLQLVIKELQQIS